MGEERCKSCGAELSGDGGEKLCPRCAVLLALETSEGGLPPDERPPARETGRKIGHYRLIRRLGEGGMGEVWLAEQSEPVRREVALKIIKRGLDTERFVARFERERQALAMMSHPAVARIFDAGSTADGLPYFVMEYVPGEPINEHCEKHALSLKERLELFRKVCDGVHHAHQKAIVHRDLKPTNVLVVRDGDRSYPKIIDFGVAKAIGERDPDRTLFTELGALVGTPEYMSPEQALAGEDALDTRTDVYSLGVLLYELLTGVLPFESRRLRSAGYEGIRRVILEEEPDRPSTRLGTLGGEARTLRGDLDWITMKALSKEPERRYASCAEFSADIVRHLQAEPVLAGPPSAVYRAGKFVKRNRATVTASAAILLLLVAALVVTTSLWRTARTQRRLAEERYDRVLQLSDLKRVRDYEAEADRLWPAHPERIPELEAWLSEKALPLAGSLDRHRAALAELRERALPYDEEQRRSDLETHPLAAELRGYRAYVEEKLALIPRIRADLARADREEIAAHYERRVAQARAEIARLEPIVHRRRTWEFRDDRTRWQHDMMTDLVEKLERFTDPDPFVGAIASVRRRLEFASTIEERSVAGTEVARAWDRAIRAIADSPRYGQLRLTPQLGLVPLGPDPATGLWEFWHVGSGEKPLPGSADAPANPWRIEESSGMVFVLVPGGTFRMGAQADDPAAPNFDPAAARRERNVHPVELAPFFLSKYEMTQAQWIRLTGDNPSRHDPGEEWIDHVVDGTHPVEMVSWEEASGLMRRLALALPSEAQWEYAARAGTAYPWWSGPTKESLRGAENLMDRTIARQNSSPTAELEFERWLDDGHVVHAPVGSYRANPWGLHDMLGNVGEWCREFYVSPYRASEAPGDGFQDVPVGTASRVHRGGSWRSLALDARVSKRGNTQVGDRDVLVGIRPARPIRP